MKTINVAFENDEYKKLAREKGGLTWHDFIMKLTQGASRRELGVFLPKQSKTDVKPHRRKKGGIVQTAKRSA